MKIRNFAFCIIAFLVFSVIGAPEARAQIFGKLLTVNDSGDTTDASPGDGSCLDAAGKCTIRAALQEANSAPNQDVIVFDLPALTVIDLSLGELPVNSSVYVLGPGASKLFIQRSHVAGADFRVFHVGPNAGNGIFLRGFSISNGQAPLGGGLYIESGSTVSLTDLAINGHSAGAGGAIANAGTLNMTRSSVSGNAALTTLGDQSSLGGGLINLGANSKATISNSTFTGNSSTSGGGIFNRGTLLLINNTLTGNSATQRGAGVSNEPGGVAHVLNTIIGRDLNAPSLAGSFTSLGSNIITDARNAAGFANGVNGDQVSNDNSIDPLLGNFDFHGGQTLNFDLLSGSVAINQGNSCVVTATCPSPVPSNFVLRYDQRKNYSRRAGGVVDVGAFEYNAPTLSSNATIGIFGGSNWLYGSLATLTRAATNEKQHRIATSFGNLTFQNLIDRDTYVLEIKSKRAGRSSLLVLDFEILGIPIPLRSRQPFGDIVITEQP
ncbi:MAG TPA: choice-of-anchor Q domain-containing protein [Pyrinomonadaceae bacterium]